MWSGAAQYTVPPAANASYTTIWNVPSGNWTTASNWIAGVGGAGGVPDVASQDFALINNAGTSLVNSVVAPQAGGVILGELAANSGTLDIQSGGVLTVSDQRPTFTADGSVEVGRAGTGTFFVRRGGTLNAASIALGGQLGSTMTLGGTTGSGNATVSLTGAATLGRTTRVIGPNVVFNSGSITLQGTSIFIPEFTGATHSTLKASGNVAVGGTLQVDLNGASDHDGQHLDSLRRCRGQWLFCFDHGRRRCPTRARARIPLSSRQWRQWTTGPIEHCSAIGAQCGSKYWRRFHFKPEQSGRSGPCDRRLHDPVDRRFVEHGDVAKPPEQFRRSRRLVGALPIRQSTASPSSARLV